MSRNQHMRLGRALTRLKPQSTKGAWGRHIIAFTPTKTRDYSLHATKGYRSSRR
jgi:hypothetical protein